MSTTNFYFGSLRYDHTGRKRKNHCANPVRKKRQEFKPLKIDPVKQQRALEAQKQREKEKYSKVLKLNRISDIVILKLFEEKISVLYGGFFWIIIGKKYNPWMNPKKIKVKFAPCHKPINMYVKKVVIIKP